MVWACESVDRQGNISPSKFISKIREKNIRIWRQFSVDNTQPSFSHQGTLGTCLEDNSLMYVQWCWHPTQQVLQEAQTWALWKYCLFVNSERRCLNPRSSQFHMLQMLVNNKSSFKNAYAENQNQHLRVMRLLHAEVPAASSNQNCCKVKTPWSARTLRTKTNDTGLHVYQVLHDTYYRSRQQPCVAVWIGTSFQTNSGKERRKTKWCCMDIWGDFTFRSVLVEHLLGLIKVPQHMQMFSRVHISNPLSLLHPAHIIISHRSHWELNYHYSYGCSALTLLAKDRCTFLYHHTEIWKTAFSAKPLLSSGKLRGCTGRHVGFATALVRTLDELLFLDLPEITMLIFTDLYEVLHEVK